MPKRTRTSFKSRPYKKARFNRAVRRVIMKTSETKRAQVASYVGLGLTTATDSKLVHDINTGDTKATRDGEEAYLRSLYGRLTIGYNAAGGTAQVVRIVLYHPYQQDDVLSSLDYTTTIESERYQVFLDKLITVNADNPVKIVKLAKRWYSRFRPGMKMVWTSGTGTDISRGACYLAITSDQAANGPTVNGTVYCWFKDP